MSILALRYSCSFVCYQIGKNRNTQICYYSEGKVVVITKVGDFYTPPSNVVRIIHNGSNHYDYLKQFVFGNTESAYNLSRSLHKTNNTDVLPKITRYDKDGHLKPRKMSPEVQQYLQQKNNSYVTLTIIATKEGKVVKKCSTLLTDIFINKPSKINTLDELKNIHHKDN